MAELNLNLYDLNKQLIATRKKLNDKELKRDMGDIAMWFSSQKENRYFMLLCHELRDYTLFRFDDGSKRTHDGSMELLEVLQSRGEVIDITYEPNVYPIWVRTEDGDFLYHLFPYDAGVIEV